MKRIGIDIGRVIIDSDTDENLIFTEKYLEAKEVKDSFSKIRDFCKNYGSENIYLVSKCGDSIQKKTKEWLEYKDFYTKTNFNKENLYFCYKREDKYPIAKKLNLNLFIDDRYSVLEYFLNDTGIDLYLFNPTPNEKIEFTNSKNKSRILLVENWNSLPL
jgi:uncharacterized HAD superfamily protein